MAFSPKSAGSEAARVGSSSAMRKPRSGCLSPLLPRRGHRCETNAGWTLKLSCQVISHSQRDCTASCSMPGGASSWRGATGEQMWLPQWWLWPGCPRGREGTACSLELGGPCRQRCGLHSHGREGHVGSSTGMGRNVGAWWASIECESMERGVGRMLGNEFPQALQSIRGQRTW